MAAKPAAKPAKKKISTHTTQVDKGRSRNKRTSVGSSKNSRCKNKAAVRERKGR